MRTSNYPKKNMLVAQKKKKKKFISFGFWANGVIHQYGNVKNWDNISSGVYIFNPNLRVKVTVVIFKYTFQLSLSFRYLTYMLSLSSLPKESLAHSFKHTFPFILYFLS